MEIDLGIVFSPILLIGIAILVRKFFPSRIFIALPLSVIFGPFGHFYIKRGLSYAVTVILFGFAVTLITKNEIILFLAGSVFSFLLMLFRFKIESIRKLEQGS